ncbi:MAG: hypothetical protein QOJ89_1179, partial [bacterium]
MRGPQPRVEPLVEREGDLALIADALSEASNRHGRLVVIDGPAGIGKTRLLERSAELAERAGFRPLMAGGHELERDLAFGVVRQLFERELPDPGESRREELLAGAAGLSASVFGPGFLAGSDIAPDSAYGLLHGIHWLVVNMSAEGPLALFVDDVQWSDELSLRALGYLGRRLDGLPVVIVAAARPAVEARASRDALDALSSHRDAVVVSPRPLSANGTAALVGALAQGAISGAAVAAIHDVTRGNPFLIVESVRSLSDSNETITVESVATLARSAPESLSHAMMLRLGALGPDAVAVARAAAVLNEDGDLAQIGALTQLERPQVLAATTMLVEARIFADGTPLRFVHPLLQAAVYGDQTEMARAFSHERAAAVLVRFAADAGRIAAHLLLSRPAGDADAASRLHRAAEDAAAKGDPATAARYWRRALAEPPSRDQRPPVLLGLGLAELAVGDAAAAIEPLRGALEVLVEPPERVRAALALAQAMMVVHDVQSAVEALDMCRDGLDDDALLRIDVERTGIAMFIPALAEDGARRQHAFAALEGRTYNERLALASAALARLFDASSTADAAASIAERALREDTVVADWAADTLQIAIATGVLLYAERFDAAERIFARALEAARARGSGMGFAVASVMVAQMRVVQGRLAESIADSEAVLRTAADLPRTPLFDRFFLAAPSLLLAWALTECGEIDRATSVLHDATDGRELHSPELCPMLHARGLVRLASGEDLEGALADFLAYGAVTTQMGYEERIVLWRLRAAQTAAALGDHDQAVALAQDGVSIARVWDTPGCLGAALRVAALVGVPADGDRCEQLA